LLTKIDSNYAILIHAVGLNIKGTTMTALLYFV